MIKIVLITLNIYVFLYGNSLRDLEKSIIPQCGFDLLIHQKNKIDNIYKKKMENTIIHSKRFTNFPIHREILNIPIVFNVMYHTEIQNIPVYVFQNEIQQLNLDFRRQNENAIETRELFIDIAGDANIEFYLASEDPRGNETNGTTHHYSEIIGFQFMDYDDLVSGEFTLDRAKKSNQGGVDPWDTDRYLNIWICNIEYGIMRQIMGFTYPPIAINDALNYTSSDAQPNWDKLDTSNAG